MKKIAYSSSLGGIKRLTSEYLMGSIIDLRLCGDNKWCIFNRNGFAKDFYVICKNNGYYLIESEVLK